MTIIGKNPTQTIFDELPLPSSLAEPDAPKVHNKYHKTAPLDAVYVGRGSPWGNPFVIGKHGTREEVIERYRIEVLPQLDLTQLKGRHLVCFCKPKACHADLLLEAANQ